MKKKEMKNKKKISKSKKKTFKKELTMKKKNNQEKDSCLPSWEKRTKQEKIVSILGVNLSILTIIFCTTYLCGIFPNGPLFFMPSVCGAMSCQTILWKEYDHKVSTISLVCAICAFIGILIDYTRFLKG